MLIQSSNAKSDIFSTNPHIYFVNLPFYYKIYKKFRNSNKRQKTATHACCGYTCMFYCKMYALSDHSSEITDDYQG